MKRKIEEDIFSNKKDFTFDDGNQYRSKNNVTCSKHQAHYSSKMLREPVIMFVTSDLVVVIVIGYKLESTDFNHAHICCLNVIVSIYVATINLNNDLIVHIVTPFLTCCVLVHSWWTHVINP